LCSLCAAASRANSASPAASSSRGAFYGRAKLCRDLGDRAGCFWNLLCAYLTAVFLHGFYDSCAMIGNVLSTLLFVIFVIVMYVVVFKKVRRESQTDKPV